MENGTFQNLTLSHLDFEPPSKPTASGFTERGTSSFQTLMAQNEDLVARLRVTLKRLSILEDENQNLQQNFEAVKTQSAAVMDQLLIWREKEKIWKDREDALEKSFRDKTREMDIELSLLRQKTEQLEVAQEHLDRYKKYHEKVKTSVKPYIQKLKSYTRSLFEQTQELNNAILQKETVITNKDRQIEELKFETEKLKETFEFQKNQLISMFEVERHDLKGEIKSLHEQNETLVEKTRHLDRSLERQDELENLVVALRRTKEDLTHDHQKEAASLRETVNRISTELKTWQLKGEDSNTELRHTKEALAKCEQVRTQTEEQLTSLRYLWTQKSQENERLKMSLSSLEKINLELSQKLTELRDAQDPPL